MLRSSSRPKHHLGRAASGASALALAFAFLAPKPAAAVPFWEDLTTTRFPAPDPYCKLSAPSNQAGCYTSWLVATDLDSDGDLDILYANGGGYYNPNSNNNYPAVEPSTVYLNDGLGNFTDVTTPMFAGAASRLRQVGVVDVNGDGLKDVYQPGGYGLDLDKLWIQTAPGVFENQAATLLPPELKSNTPGFHFGDLDGDGDADLITTDWATAQGGTLAFLTLYLNDGHGKFTLEEEEQDPGDWLPTDRFPATIPPTTSFGPYYGSRAIDLDFADIDNDFDLDILVNMRNGVSRIFLNDGTGHFKDGNGKVTEYIDPVLNVPRIRSNYPQKLGPYVYNQELCDFDNDGDLDMFLDNAAARPTGVTSGNFTQVLVNNGKGVFTDESRLRIFGETGSDDNAVKCVDVNNDGNYDLLVASLAGASEKLLLADGTGKFNMVPDAFPKINDSTLGIDAADFDGDGLMDVITGQGEGRSFFEDRFYHGVASPDGNGSVADSRPPKFRSIEKPIAIPGQPIIVRMAVTDAHTSETGDMVKDVSVVYSTPFGENGKVKATYFGGDLFRAVIPPMSDGTILTINAQATDRRNLKGFGTPVIVTVKNLPPPDTGEGGAGGGGGAGGEPPVVEPVGGAGGEPPVTEPVAGAGGESTTGGTDTGGTDTGGTDTGGTDTGGSLSTGGTSTAGTSTGGTESSAAGEGGAPSSAGSSGSGGPVDDGCSVSTTASSTSGGGWLAALGLSLVLGRRRRNKQRA